MLWSGTLLLKKKGPSAQWTSPCLPSSRPTAADWAPGLPICCCCWAACATARACFCYCWLLLHRNESPILTPSPYPLQFLLFKCVLQALEGWRGWGMCRSTCTVTGRWLQSSASKTRALGAHTAITKFYPSLCSPWRAGRHHQMLGTLHCRTECHRWQPLPHPSPYS